MSDENLENIKKPRNKKEIEFDKDLSVSYNDRILVVKGKKGQAEKLLNNKLINIKVESNKIIIESKRFGKKSKKVMATFEAHIKNLLEGAKNGFRYTLKICSGHFPMSVSVNNNEFAVKNFLGEKIPRKLKIKEGANVKVEGDKILVESNNKEIVGQVSADIENLTKRPGYDGRIFQDGCYITSKGDKEIKQ